MNRRALRDLFKAATALTLAGDSSTVWESVVLVLIGEAAMCALSRHVLGVPQSTDVYSYRYPLPPAGAGRLHGEIIVNIERAWTVGSRYAGRDFELARYIVHGCLHLAGWTDETPAARARMRRRETALLRRWPQWTAGGALFRECAP